MSKVKEPIKTYSDQSCPKCGFPESVITWEDIETAKAKSIECSSRDCDAKKEL